MINSDIESYLRNEKYAIEFISHLLMTLTRNHIESVKNTGQ